LPVGQEQQEAEQEAALRPPPVECRFAGAVPVLRGSRPVRVSGVRVGAGEPVVLERCRLVKG
jgi:hypothetical protein